jgi:hypothetical protein
MAIPSRSMYAKGDMRNRGTAVAGGHGMGFPSVFRFRGSPLLRRMENIVAAGIEEVIYVEPYPKSLASTLHDDSIAIDDLYVRDKVRFLPSKSSSLSYDPGFDPPTTATDVRRHGLPAFNRYQA